MEKGCRACEKYKEHYYRDHLNGKGVEFYELMHGDFSEHLRIPKKFAYYCRQLPETVDVKGPGGKIWPVGLKETNDGMLLQSGWKEFVEAHGIQESYLLLFKYDGKSCFDISIFDEKHCKTEASYLIIESNSEEGGRGENPVEILNGKPRHKVVMRSSSGIPHDDMPHAPRFSITREISRENENAASKYQRTSSGYERRIYRSNELSSDPKNNRCDHCPDNGSQGKRYSIKQEAVDIDRPEKLGHPNVYMSQKLHLTDEEEGRALYLLHSVQPSNPCFISFLQFGSVNNGCFMYIPARFQKAHLPSKRRNDVYLQVPDQQKRWCFQLLVYRSMTRFRWESFVIDNSLQVGDVCLFELVEDLKDIVMTVNILHAAGQDAS